VVQPADDGIQGGLVHRKSDIPHKYTNVVPVNEPNPSNIKCSEQIRGVEVVASVQVPLAQLNIPLEVHLLVKEL